jgi:short subunit dehydrogenase-like uncharacterized protein
VPAQSPIRINTEIQSKYSIKFDILAIAQHFQFQSQLALVDHKALLVCKMSRPYEIVVWGSTGFTGKLTCEYLAKTYPDLKWAIAGRNKTALQAVKSTLNLPEAVDILVGSVDDPGSLLAITSKTKVLLTTAGPYAKIGMPMVEACVKGGAHYCDLTGEAPFIRDVIDRFSDEA